MARDGRTDGRSHSLEPGRRVREPGPTCEQFLICLGEKLLILSHTVTSPAKTSLHWILTKISGPCPIAFRSGFSKVLRRTFEETHGHPAAAHSRGHPRPVRRSAWRDRPPGHPCSIPSAASLRRSGVRGPLHGRGVAVTVRWFSVCVSVCLSEFQ